MKHYASSSPRVKSFPKNVQSSLVECVTEESFDDARFAALVSEHHVGLSKGQFDSLVDEVYALYVETNHLEA
jgi:hypothetical protein